MVDALKRASAKRITVVMPFYGYARQDKKHRGREPISARLMADLFKTAGADRLITVDLHADQIQGFFDGPVDHLMALPILADYVREKYGDQRLAVVSPDAGRIKVAERWSARLGGAPLAFIHKTRNIDRPNETMANRVVGHVEGRICVLVDDMIDTGGTIVKAAEALMADGAAGVVIAATHAILSDPAVDRLKNSPASEVIVTNTLPISAECEFDKLTTLSIAPLVSRAIREVFEDGSVTSMFDGHARSGTPCGPDAHWSRPRRAGVGVQVRRPGGRRRRRPKGVAGGARGGQSARMTSYISHTTDDCANAYELSEWWKQVLGYVDLDGDPNLPGHEAVSYTHLTLPTTERV